MFKRFLALFPYRIESLVKRAGTKSWREVSRFHYLSDDEIAESLTQSSKVQRAVKADTKTQWLAISIAENSIYQNSSSIKLIRDTLKSHSINTVLYQVENDLYLFLFFNEQMSTELLSRLMRKWCQAERLDTSPENLRIQSPSEAVPLPLQNDFVWLNDSCVPVLQRKDMAPELALSHFLADFDANAMTPDDFIQSLEQLIALKDLMESTEIPPGESVLDSADKTLEEDCCSAEVSSFCPDAIVDESIEDDVKAEPHAVPREVLDDTHMSPVLEPEDFSPLGDRSHPHLNAQIFVQTNVEAKDLDNFNFSAETHVQDPGVVKVLDTTLGDVQAELDANNLDSTHPEIQGRIEGSILDMVEPNVQAVVEEHVLDTFELDVQAVVEKHVLDTLELGVQADAKMHPLGTLETDIQADAKEQFFASVEAELKALMEELILDPDELVVQANDHAILLTVAKLDDHVDDIVKPDIPKASGVQVDLASDLPNQGLLQEKQKYSNQDQKFTETFAGDEILVQADRGSVDDLKPVQTDLHSSVYGTKFVQADHDLRIEKANFVQTTAEVYGSNQPWDDPLFDSNSEIGLNDNRSIDRSSWMSGIVKSIQLIMPPPEAEKVSDPSADGSFQIDGNQMDMSPTEMVTIDLEKPFSPEREPLSNKPPKELRPATRQPCPGMSGQDKLLLQTDSSAHSSNFDAPPKSEKLSEPRAAPKYPESLNTVNDHKKLSASQSPNAVSPPLLSRLAQLSEANSFDELMSVTDLEVSSAERSTSNLKSEYVAEIEDEQGRQLLLFPMLKPPVVQDNSLSKRFKRLVPSAAESEQAAPDTG